MSMKNSKDTIGNRTRGLPVCSIERQPIVPPRENQAIIIIIIIIIITYSLSFLLTYLITYLLIYSLTYLLTPCSRVLLENLTCLQPVKKFPAFYGNRMFITAFTSALNLSQP